MWGFMWGKLPLKAIYSIISKVNGGLGRIRTPDPLIRSQVLYPTELPIRVSGDLDGDYLRCKAQFTFFLILLPVRAPCPLLAVE